MYSKNQAIQHEGGAKEVVLSFIEALNEDDFDGARSHVDDNLLFEGVMGTRNNADEYIKDMRKMKLNTLCKKYFKMVMMYVYGMILRCRVSKFSALAGIK